MTFTWPDTAIEIGIILVFAILIRGIVVQAINRSIRQASKRAEKQRQQERPAFYKQAAKALVADETLGRARQAHRTKALGTLLRSFANALIWLTAAFMILKALNVNVAPALASAGIGGIALGFGAQSIVKDLISGIFIILEDQYGIGDFITIGDITGTVDNIGLRVTRLQDATGQYWYVRNGEIVTLGNQSQGWSQTIVSVPVSRSEDPYRVIEILEAVCESFRDDDDFRRLMLDPPKALGLSSVEANAANYSITVRCPGNEQWALEREVRARVVQRFAEENIAGPQILATV